MCPLGRPGRRTCTQRLPSLPLTAPITGSTVRTWVSGRTAATGSMTRACVLGGGTGDVILEQDHERLGHGDVRRGRAHGAGDGRAGAGDDERRGERDEGEVPHPVNAEGPVVGLSTASAQAL